MSAPVIQPSNPSGGAPLAPGAGSAGANTTINPAETRVQQEAAAAQAAQQASAAYAKRERDVREYTDALVDYHGLPDEFRSTEAPEMTMVNRRGSEISSLRSPNGVDLAANARSAETQRFADWEQDQQFDGDKLHRARDFLYYQRERAAANTTGYFNVGLGKIEKDLIDVQQAYNEARLNDREFSWDGKTYTVDEIANLESSGMPDWRSSQWMKESRLANPTGGRAGILLDPNSAESQQKLEAEYQEYLKFRDTPLTFENKVYMPRVASERIAADAAQNAARVEYNAAQNADLAGRIAMAESMGISLDTLSKLDASYRATAAEEAPFSPQTIDISGMDANTKHALMVDLGLKTFDELDAVIESRNNQIIEAYNAGYSSPEAMQAAEKAAWTAYQNRSAAEQTNPVLRDYAAAAEREAEYNLLGQPVGIARVPTLTNAEKYAVLNEMSPGQYLYNPLTDQISKKQQVNTSDYLTTKWYNDFVNSEPVSAIRETFGIDNWNKQIEEIKEEAGIVEGDTTGKGFAYGVIEPFLNLGLNLGPIALRMGNEIEHTVRNSEEFLTMPASQFLGNVGAKIYDTYLEFEKDPHHVAGNIVGSLLLGYLSGTAGVGAISRIGSKGSAGVFRAADTPHAPFGKDTPSFSSGLFGTVRSADADSAVRTPGISESVADVSDLVPYHQAMGYRYDPFQQNNRIYGYAVEEPKPGFWQSKVNEYVFDTNPPGFTPNEARGLVLNQRQNNFENSMMRLVLDETEKGRARQERARIEDQLGWKEAAAWENRQKSIQNPTWDFDKGELRLYDRATTEFGFTPNEARGLILNQRQSNFENSMMRLVLDETKKGRARQERARIEDQLGWKEAAAWENRQKSLQNPTWDFDKGELRLYDRATTEFGFTPNEARGLILNQRQSNFQNSMMRLVLDETEKGRARQERARIEDQLGWKEAAAWENRQKSLQNPTWDFDKGELKLYDRATTEFGFTPNEARGLILNQRQSNFQNSMMRLVLDETEKGRARQERARIEDQLGWKEAAAWENRQKSLQNPTWDFDKGELRLYDRATTEFGFTPNEARGLILNQRQNNFENSMMRLVLDETEKGRARQERARIEDQLGWKEAAAWETRQKSLQNPTWDFDKGELKLYDRATTEFGFTPNEARGLILNQRQSNFENSMMRLVLDETEKGRARQERARIEDQLGWKEAAAWENRQKSIQNPTWDFDKGELKLYDKLTANYRPPQQRAGGRQIMMPRQMQDVRYTIVFPKGNIKPPKQVTTKAADQQNLLMMEPRETAGGQIMMPRQRQDAEYTIILPREKNIKTPKQVANKAQIQEAKQLSAVTSVIVGQNHDDERKSRRISLPGIEVSQEIGKKTLNIADKILNVNTTEQTPRTAAILRQDVVPVNRVNNVTITTPIESVITRQDIVPINRLYNINRTLTIPRTPRPPRIPIPRRRRRTDRTDDPFGGYRKIKPQNLDHASILDPLQAINPKTKSYMTNTRTPKARGTLYEFDGIISPTPPAWATESPKKKPTKKTKTKNKPSKRKQTTHRHTQKTNKPTQKRR